MLLAVVSLLKLRPKVMYALSWIAAVMILAQVLLMRWNVVIGGQLLSKSFHGYTSYVPGIFVKEGIVTAIVIFTAPFLVLWIFDKIVPLFPHAIPADAKTKKAKA
jgi:predicted membrane protein